MFKSFNDHPAHSPSRSVVQEGDYKHCIRNTSWVIQICRITNKLKLGKHLLGYKLRIRSQIFSLIPHTTLQRAIISQNLMQRNLKLKYQSHLTNTVLLLSYGPKISNSGLLELRVKALQPFLSTAEVLRENLGI